MDLGALGSERRYFFNGSSDQRASRSAFPFEKDEFLPNRQQSRQRAYAKLAANPEWREQHNGKQRERYYNDPAFRARKLA